MLKNYTRSERKTSIEYELVFDDGANNGYGFPCDKDGNLLPAPEHPSIDHNKVDEARQRNLQYALAHPEKYVRFNKVVKYERSYREPPRGLCECGREIVLYNQYLGACECECGRWYNLFGQELNPPSQWEEMEDW